MKKTFLSLFCTITMVCALFTTTAVAVENPFSDIDSESTLAQAVMWAYENNITKGTEDTLFSPDKTCTRGQVVTFLWRSQGEPAPSSNENQFTDVSEDAYYYEAVLWAVDKGITSGTSTTEFSPDKTCTTAEVLTFLYRANGEPNKTGEGLYYVDAINWATDTGLITSVDPSSQSPRSDIVTYLWKNAGAPEIEVTDPEPVVYTYNYPEYTVPSSELELSWEYFAEIFSYLVLSGEEKFTFTATGYTFEELAANTNWTELRNDGLDYAIASQVDIFKLYYSFSYTRSTSGDARVNLYLTYDESIYSSQAEVEADKEAFFDMASELVTGFYNSGALKETDSDMVVARYLYDWVCDNISYNLDAANPYSAYATLTTGEGVCMGYAGLINALYRTAGIECFGVGCSVNGDGHTINYANLDGTWYYIDATFGDTANNYSKYFAMTRSTVDGIYVLDHKWA